MSRYARPLAQYGPWTRLLPASEYRGEDDAAGERPTLGWGRTFPHPLTDAPVSPFARWAVSPAGDEALAALARAALTEMKLGQGPGTDVLGVSLSETDLVGHAFGPRSHEVQDTLLRVDRLLGELLDALDSQLPDQYTLVLASDHGVAAIPEQVAGGGRLLPANAKKGLDAALAAELGPGEHAIGLQLNEVYLAPGVHQRLVKKPGALGRVLTALRALPGIADVFDSAELGDASGLEGPRKAAALGYFQGRSGDLVIAPKPNWIVGALGTNHGSTGDYDQHVPVIFFGQGVKPGQYDRAVTPADVAPTLARIVGVKMPRAEGAPINEVLAPAPARRAVRRPR